MGTRSCTKRGHIQGFRTRKGEQVEACLTCIRDGRRRYKERKYEETTGKPMPGRQPADLSDESLETWVAFAENEPELTYRILMIRFMLEQRRFSIRTDVLSRSKYSRAQLYMSINPKHIRLRGSGYKNNTVTIDVALKVLDEIESIITALTDEGGGVYGVTGSTPETADVFRGVLDSSRREQLYYGAEEEAF